MSTSRLVGSLCLAMALASPGAADVRKLQTTVTASQPRARMVSVLEGLPSGRLLSVGDDLKKTKLTVRVAGEPEGQVLVRIAQVVGGEWKPSGSGSSAYELRREPAVAQWLAEWRRARRAGERAAFEYQAALITRFQNEAFASIDKELPLDADGKPIRPDRVGNVSLARLVKSFPAGMREQLVRSMVALAPVRAGEDQTIPFPIHSLAFDSLTSAQQNLVRDWCSGSGQPGPSVVSTLLIESGGVGLDFLLFDKSGKFLSVGGAVHGELRTF